MASGGNSASMSSGRHSVSSTGSSGSNSSATIDMNMSATGGVGVVAGPVSFIPLPCYRRMTPEEDLIATLQGINLLVSQRQELVNQLTRHYRHLQRSNEIDSLLKFSQKIDHIMRIRGIPTVMVSTPAMNDAKSVAGTRKGDARGPGTPQNVTRGVTFQWQEFRPRDLEAKSGLKSLRRVLEIDELKKFSKKKGEPKV